ncbi:MAG TPA: hypothetical protein VFY79_00555 [Dehalococcoidia bacterium]|nr:hypothetical protein [Dehalococcoidia bacterium]
MRTTRTIRSRHAALATALLLCAALAASACLMRKEHFVDNYRTVVASASRDHYTAYWLGYGFTAGGLQFNGPITGDFAYDVPGGGVTAEYSADLNASHAAVVLTLTCYGPAAWSNWQALHPHANDGATRTPVTFGTRRATLVTAPFAGHPNYFAVEFHLGETTVLARTSIDAGHPNATPNPNPLVDVQTLLAVLANLRPYPQ